MEKIKSWVLARERELIFGAALFLASTLSFASGYAANRESNHAPIVIEACSTVARGELKALQAGQKENPR